MKRNKHDSAYEVIALGAGDTATAAIALGEYCAKRREGEEVGGT